MINIGKNICSCPFLTTKDRNLLWLQYRINHNILAIKSFQQKIGLSHNNKCTFCNNVIETLEHIFWNCEKTQSLINHFKNILITKNINLPFDKKTFIFGLF